MEPLTLVVIAIVAYLAGFGCGMMLMSILISGDDD